MAKKDFSRLPMDILITNTSSNEVGVQFFKTNLTYPLKGGDLLKVKAQSSAELSYFFSKIDRSLDMTIAEPYVVSAIAYMVDDDPIVFIGNKITTVVGSELDYVEATVNVPVEVVGTPKAYITIDDVEYVYGTITVDSENPYKVIVTPDGSNGTSGIAGNFNIKIEEDSIKYTDGNFSNQEIIIELTVIAE